MLAAQAAQAAAFFLPGRPPTGFGYNALAPAARAGSGAASLIFSHFQGVRSET